MISLALRMTIGTMGTPACIARWKPPFLKGPTVGVTDRVPSGAITTDVPTRNLSRAGCSAAMALARSARSRNATSAIRNSCPITGTCAISFLATKVKPSRSSLLVTTRSMSALWWLMRNTAGRCDHRCCCPRTSILMSPTAPARSPNTEVATSTPRRRSRFSTPMVRPVPLAASRLPYMAAVRKAGVGSSRRGRLLKWSTGQPRAEATLANRFCGLTGWGCPTACKKGTSSSPLA